MPYVKNAYWITQQPRRLDRFDRETQARRKDRNAKFFGANTRRHLSSEPLPTFSSSGAAPSIPLSAGGLNASLPVDSSLKFEPLAPPLEEPPSPEPPMSPDALAPPIFSSPDPLELPLLPPLSSRDSPLLPLHPLAPLLEGVPAPAPAIPPEPLAPPLAVPPPPEPTILFEPLAPPMMFPP